MAHANAKLTAAGRMAIIEYLEEGYTQAETARRLKLSRATVSKWWRRYREEGIEGLRERSSRAKRLAHALAQPVLDEICRLRRELGVGPHRLAWLLSLPRSTIYAVLRRAGLHRLDRLEQTTRTIIRYERDRPGELVHLDVKKLGRIPEGGGKRFDPGFAETGIGRSRPGKRGHECLHVAVDDHSRYAYAELLPDEKGPTTAGFLARTILAFARVGITIESVLTDNAWNYRRSSAFICLASLHGIARLHTRPYSPQTNGKAEAFNKTAQREWAYRRKYLSNKERLDALAPFLDEYNRSRPHTSLGGRSPASRL